MKKILVTDSLFIFKEHEEKLEAAGFEVERLDKPNASEEELIEALSDKEGYILGGIEKITQNVIANAPKLEAVSLTVSDWKWFMPGYEEAAKRGIVVSNAKGGNAYAVAEYSMAGILMLVRNIIGLGRCGEKTFQTTNSIKDLTFGIIGLGEIGSIVARMLVCLGAKEVIYYSRTRKDDLEKELRIRYVEFDEIFVNSDVIANFVPKSEGTHIKEKEFDAMKDGVILINNGSPSFVDIDVMYENLKKGKIKVFQDRHIDEQRFKDLPKDIWLNSNMGTAYNTYHANKLTSDIVTDSMINLLNGKDDKYKVL